MEIKLLLVLSVVAILYCLILLIIIRNDRQLRRLRSKGSKGLTIILSYCLPCRHNNGKVCEYCQGLKTQDGKTLKKGCFYKGYFVEKIKKCPKKNSV